MTLLAALVLAVIFVALAFGAADPLLDAVKEEVKGGSEKQIEIEKCIQSNPGMSYTECCKQVTGGSSDSCG